MLIIIDRDGVVSGRVEEGGGVVVQVVQVDLKLTMRCWESAVRGIRWECGGTAGVEAGGKGSEKPTLEVHANHHGPNLACPCKRG